jgi:hypothetical protein
MGHKVQINNLVLCLRYSLSCVTGLKASLSKHHAIKACMGCGCNTPCILDSAIVRLVCHLHIPATLPLGKGTQWPWIEGQTQIQSGHYKEEKNPCLCWKWSPNYPALSQLLTAWAIPANVPGLTLAFIITVGYKEIPAHNFRSLSCTRVSWECSQDAGIRQVN